ncbi:hypothetical protein BN946_scf184756.g30 [Trametes cinnabarina]|uniref:Uncharacterized protein n=1 Tax=Pycnoporus cinnabarinus TaxID=5643 RepID=A0A060SE46_PYCCI|nr:hypothetical protein BN946_scf184756.g30 [Trametes cinnabarina]
MILALPVEELPLIDTICLAVTCKKLFCLSAHILEKERNISSSYWAHCRLACIGDYAAYDKAPDSLIPPAMKDEIRLALKKSPHDWHYAGTEALNFLEGQPVTYTALQEELQHRFFIMCLPESDRRRFLALTAIYFPARDDWVLCNTVKKEFVRAGPLAALSGHPHDPQPFLEDSHIDLGMALMTRFSWSSSDDTTGLGECVKDGKFGSWAGDRFCITTIEREADLSGPEYKDVTDEIIEDIKNIYQREDRKLDGTNGPVQYRFYQWDRDLERFFGTGQDFEEDKKWAKAMALQSQKRLARRNAALR